MNRRYLLALLCVGLVFSAALVRADDDGEESGNSSSEGEGEAHPTPKAAVAKAKPAAKSAPSEQVAVDALAKLPVEPLAMDAAALKDDDRLFDQFPKHVSGEQNVESLTASLKKAAALLQKMKRDVEGEKVWTKNVYDIIQNYQYKYLKTVKDVQMREAKIAKMERLVSLMKQSTLHAAVEKELEKASKVLGELVTRGGSSHSYDQVTTRMNQLKSALKTMPHSRELFTDTTSAMQSILSTDLPPHTGDAVKDLANGVESVRAAQQTVIEHSKPAVAAKPAAAKPAAAKPAAAKPAAKPKAAAAKKPAPKKVVKPKKGGAKKPKTKKAAPKKAAAKEEEDD